MYVCMYGKHNGIVACRFDEATKMNAGSSILEGGASGGAGNVLPDPWADMKSNKHNGDVACRFDEVTKMNARSSILKREASGGAGNVLPDPGADVKVSLNNGCFCGHYAAHLKA